MLSEIYREETRYQDVINTLLSARNILEDSFIPAEEKGKFACGIICLLIGTSKEKLIQCFPIEKNFKNKRYGLKDYWDHKRAYDTSVTYSSVFKDLKDVIDFIWDVVPYGVFINIIVMLDMYYVSMGSKSIFEKALSNSFKAEPVKNKNERSYLKLVK